MQVHSRDRHICRQCDRKKRLSSVVGLTRSQLLVGGNPTSLCINITCQTSMIESTFQGGSLSTDPGALLTQRGTSILKITMYSMTPVPRNLACSSYGICTVLGSRDIRDPPFRLHSFPLGTSYRKHLKPMPIYLRNLMSYISFSTGFSTVSVSVLAHFRSITYHEAA